MVSHCKGVACLLKLLGHVHNIVIRRIVLEAIGENKADIRSKGICSQVLSSSNLFLDCAKVHRLLDDVKVVMQSQFDRVNYKRKVLSFILVL